MEKIDGRTQVLKGMRGHLINTNPGKSWAAILSDLLNQHGSAAAVARALNIDTQTVRKWLKAETDSGAIVIVEQPPRVYKVAL